MGRTKYNDRHVRYRARQKIAESERNRELRRLRQFYNFMVDHDFVKVAISWRKDCPTGRFFRVPLFFAPIC